MCAARTAAVTPVTRRTDENYRRKPNISSRRAIEGGANIVRRPDSHEPFEKVRTRFPMARTALDIQVLCERRAILDKAEARLGL